MKLKQIREERGLVQSELARELQVSQSVLSYIENYRALPVPETLSKLVEVLGCSVSDLYEEGELSYSIQKAPKRSRVNEVYHLTADLPVEARDVLKKALEACGYRDITDWINHCYLRLMGKYAQKKDIAPVAGKHKEQCQPDAETASQ